jgi:hypothetical protein
LVFGGKMRIWVPCSRPREHRSGICPVRLRSERRLAGFSVPQLSVFSSLRDCDTHSLRPPKFQRPGLRLEADQIKNARFLLWGNVSRWQCHIAQERAESFLTQILRGCEATEQGFSWLLDMLCGDEYL